MSNLPPLPAGFVLDQPTRTASLPPLPAGFVLDEIKQDDEPSFLDGVVRAAGRGVFGIGSYLDEANAATNAALAPVVDPLLPDSFEKLPGKTFGERYDQALAIQRGKDKAFDEENPVTSTVAQLAGGIGSGGALLKAAPAAANVALGLGGRTMGQKALTAAAAGAATGAVQGFGAGEGGAGERAGSALVGGVVGGGVAGALSPVGQAVGAGVNAVASRMAARGAPTGARGAELLAKDLAAEGGTLESVAAKAKEMGPTAMLADASEILRLRTEQLAQSDNPARTGVIEALKTRSAGARDRLGSAYDASIGETPDVQETLDGIMQSRAEAAAPLYQKALAQPVIMDERLARFVNDPIMAKGVARGFEIQRMEAVAKGEDFNPVDYKIVLAGADGEPVMQDVPNMRTMQIAKVGLDALVTDSKDQFGRLTERGRAINQFRTALLSKLDDANPDYKMARAAWEGPTKTLEAFENGRALFGAKTHPDTLKRDFKAMSDAEKDAFRLGTRAAVDEAMGRVRNGALKGRQLLDSDFNERKLKTVLGDDDAKSLIAVLNGEEAMAATSNQALANSATARRIQGNPFTGKGPLDLNQVPQSLFHAGRLLAQREVDAVGQGGRERLASELGPVLTATGDERDALVKALIEAERKLGRKGGEAPDRSGLARALVQGGSLAGSAQFPR